MADRNGDGPVDWERAHRQGRDALWAIYIEACRIHREKKGGSACS